MAEVYKQIGMKVGQVESTESSNQNLWLCLSGKVSNIVAEFSYLICLCNDKWCNLF